MPKILGLDVARCTGWAISTGRRADDIISGSHQTPKGSSILVASDSLDGFLHKLIREHGKCDFAVIEAPLQAGPNPMVLAQLNFFVGNVKSIVHGYGIPYEIVPAATWRNTMYGFGRKKGWSSPDWKKHAKFHCKDVIGVEVRNADEAEAVMISQYGFYCQRFKQLAMEAA